MLTFSPATAADGDGRVLPAGATMAVDLTSLEIADLPAPTQYFLTTFPGAKAMIDDGRVTAFYGVPLTRAATPAAAEAAFWTEHADAFGISGLALRETRSHRAGQGKFTRQGPLYLGTPGNLIAQRPIGVAVANWDIDPLPDIAVACAQTIGTQDWASIAVLWNYTEGAFANNSVVRMSTIASEGLGRGYDLTVWTDSFAANRLAMSNFQGGLGIPNVAYVVDNLGVPPPVVQVLFPMRLSRGIAVGDFDPGTDTLPDLACIESNLRSLPWRKQYSNGLFDVGGQPPLGYFTELNGWGLDAGRLSKIPSMPFQLDTTDDLIVGSSHDDVNFFPLRNAVNVLASTGLSSGDDLFVSVYAYVTEANTTQQCFPTEVHVADVNSDGFPDIVTANRGNSPLTIVDDEFERFSVLLNRK